METVLLLIFTLVYLGMAFGNLPGLVLDRTGIALLGAIGVIVFKRLSLNEALLGIDISSLAILFSFMIISSQLYFSGFYSRVATYLSDTNHSPKTFLLKVIFTTGLLSALLINDIVCLAITPLIIQICQRKSFNPVPFLIGVACSSNIGSALTLIGNPQNMLIGQALQIPFRTYTYAALIPSLLGGLITFAVICYKTTSWFDDTLKETKVETPKFDRWQTLKGSLTISLVILMFLFFEWPREHIALVAAGFLLLSRQMASKMMLSLIDWELLVLFLGLFIVNHQFNQTSFMPSLLHTLEEYKINLSSPFSIFFISSLLSNLISNVPTVMLLLPFTKTEETGTLLALSSTFAGNMFLVGSLANIIVVTQAARFGINISGKQHFSYGFPIAIATLILAFFLISYP